MASCWVTFEHLLIAIENKQESNTQHRSCQMCSICWCDLNCGHLSIVSLLPSAGLRLTQSLNERMKIRGVTLTFGPNHPLRMKRLQQRMRMLLTQNWTGGLWDISSDPDTPDTLNAVRANVLSARCLPLPAGSLTSAVQMFRARKHPRSWRQNIRFYQSAELPPVTLPMSCWCSDPAALSWMDSVKLGSQLP